MTTQSKRPSIPGFSTRPKSPTIGRARTRLVAALAVAGSCATVGCAAELEDPEQYTTRVRPGLGASGVTVAQDGKPVDPNPTVQPTVSPQNSTSAEPDESDDTTSSVSPTTSVAPATTVTPSSGVSAECADVPTRILQGKCAGTTCHGEPGSPAAAFSDIASTTDPMNLLDVPAKFTCSSKMLIDSANPADSAILSAVDADDHCSGGQMPSGGPYLTADEVSCLTEWVNAVASGAI